MSSLPKLLAAPEHFETERLRAYHLRPEHFALLLTMHQDAVIMASLGGVRSEKQTRDYMQRFLDHWQPMASGRNSTASTTLKIAVFAPMPIARVSTAIVVKAGIFRSSRNP
jgi:hypothetical protein